MDESLDEFFEFFDVDVLRDDATLIRKYLTGDIAVQTAAERLVQSLQNRATPGDDNYNLGDILANIIIPLVEQLPETHDTLVILLDTINLGYALDDIALRYGDPDFGLGSAQDVRDGWSNLNHFAALIHKANMQDLLFFAVRTLEFAWRRQGWRNGGNTSDNVLALEGHAPAAAQWINVCGQRLYDECSEAKEKWVEWEGNLEWIVVQEDLYDATRLLCQKALAEMRRISAT